jgi:hypothetical protein
LRGIRTQIKGKKDVQKIINVIVSTLVLYNFLLLNDDNWEFTEVDENDDDEEILATQQSLDAGKRKREEIKQAVLQQFNFY